MNTKSTKKPATTLASASDLKRVWQQVRGQMTKMELASRLNLRNRSTLTQLMNESNPRLKISRRLTRALREFEGGGYNAEVVAQVFIPIGTIVPAGTDVHQCAWCGKNFLRLNKWRRFHARACQLKAWRAKKKRVVTDAAKGI